MKHLEARKAEVLEDLAHGASISFLARKYQCNGATMRKHLVKWGKYTPSATKGGHRS